MNQLELMDLFEAALAVGFQDNSTVGRRAADPACKFVPVEYSVEVGVDPQARLRTQGYERPRQFGTRGGGFPQCGDADGSGSVGANDALVTLRIAVGMADGDPCVCDVDASGGLPSASDALRMLKIAVGISQTLSCVSCNSAALW